MANSQHIQLSTFIKSVHSSLREKSKFIGFKDAWTEHLENKENLEEYAKAMQTLATNHWHSNFSKNSKAHSRIEWAHKFCIEYFQDDESSEMIRQRKRELEIADKTNIQVGVEEYIHGKRLKLLDVGSCYNPFSVFELFEVTAIDIAPAQPDVVKLDFLNVNISGSFEQNKSLPCNYYDVVVFSLFLEYLPEPELRSISCEKAYKVLKPEGILFIITPDSKHVGANAPIMKTWRFILSQMGFSRIKYKKLSHIHCMAFRKSLDIRVSNRWADLNPKAGIYDKLYIPQDLQEHNIEGKNNETCTSMNFNGVNFSLELPGIQDEYFENDIS